MQKMDCWWGGEKEFGVSFGCQMGVMEDILPGMVCQTLWLPSSMPSASTSDWNSPWAVRAFPVGLQVNVLSISNEWIDWYRYATYMIELWWSSRCTSRTTCWRTGNPNYSTLCRHRCQCHSRVRQSRNQPVCERIIGGTSMSAQRKSNQYYWLFMVSNDECKKIKNMRCHALPNRVY